MQQHPAVAGQDLVGALKEHRVTLGFERLEGADADDPVHRLVELLPALEPHLNGARGVQLGQPLAGELRLRLTQRDSDDVDVIELHGAFQGSTPAAADIEQCHPGLEVQLAQREVELGVLGFLEIHIVALVVAAGVPHRRPEPQRKEVIRDVVDRL